MANESRYWLNDEEITEIITAPNHDKQWTAETLFYWLGDTLNGNDEHRLEIKYNGVPYSFNDFSKFVDETFNQIEKGTWEDLCNLYIPIEKRFVSTLSERVDELESSELFSVEIRILARMILKSVLDSVTVADYRFEVTNPYDPELFNVVMGNDRYVVLKESEMNNE